MTGVVDVWETAAPAKTRELSDEHRQMLQTESAVADDVINERGYYTLSRPQIATLVALEAVHPVVLEAEGWLGIPVTRPDGVKHGEVIRIFGGKSKNKYIWPTGTRNAFDVHPYGWENILDPSVPVLLTEGVKKADALLSAARREGWPCVVVAVNGCWGWHAKINGASVASPDFLDIAWEERRTYVISDSDFRTNDNVRKGWTEAAVYLASKTGANRTSLVVVPSSGLAKQGADDFLAAGGTLHDLLGHAQSTRHAELELNNGERAPIVLKSGLKLIREAGDRIPHIYEPLIPERAVCLVAGHSGTYKTWHALSLALDAAFGFPWLEHPKLLMRGEPVTTLYLNKEMSGAILGQRLKAMARAKRYESIPGWEDIIDERIHFADEAAIDLNVENQRDRLEDALLQVGASLTVLDSLSMCWHGDENSSTEVGAFYAHLRGITERTGTAWGIIHHLLKPQGGRGKREHPQFQVRGSGQLYQQADACIFLSHYDRDTPEDEKKYLTVHHLKARTDVEMAAWVTEFSPNDGLFVSLQYVNTLSDARAGAYAKSHGDTTKLGDWIRATTFAMPAMQPTGPGLRFRQLYDLLRTSWNIEGESPPSDQTVRRQLKAMVDDNEIVCVERNGKHGDLYQMRDPEDEADVRPPVDVPIPPVVE